MLLLLGITNINIDTSTFDHAECTPHIALPTNNSSWNIFLKFGRHGPWQWKGFHVVGVSRSRQVSCCGFTGGGKLKLAVFICSATTAAPCCWAGSDVGVTSSVDTAADAAAAAANDDDDDDDDGGRRRWIGGQKRPRRVAMANTAASSSSSSSMLAMAMRVASSRSMFIHRIRFDRLGDDWILPLPAETSATCKK